MKLLLLGDKIELNEIENTIGTEFLNLLIELGIVIKSDGYVQTDSYIIISFLDKYFLVGLPYNNPNCRIKDPSVYIGMDTYGEESLMKLPMHSYDLSGRCVGW